MAHKITSELHPGDVVFPPYEIETDQVVRVESLHNPHHRDEPWFRVFTENGVFDVSCNYQWGLSV